MSSEEVTAEQVIQARKVWEVAEEAYQIAKSEKVDAAKNLISIYQKFKDASDPSRTTPGRCWTCHGSRRVLPDFYDPYSWQPTPAWDFSANTRKCPDCFKNE